MKTEIAPTTMADRPSHIMKLPGAMISRRNNSAARMNQFQAPSEIIHAINWLSIAGLR